MTGWFARTTLLLLAFPIFLSSLLLLLISILLMAATLLLLTFQFFLFLSVHSKPPLTPLLKNKRILGPEVPRQVGVSHPWRLPPFGAQSQTAGHFRS
jgi:hypothetical protein